MNIVVEHQAGQLWRADRLAAPSGQVEPTGHPSLDAELPGGGWPVGTLTELLLPHAGIGEIRLLITPLRALMDSDRHVALLGAPHLPYGPALAGLQLALDRLLIIKADGATDRLWAAEQALKSGGIGALVVWLPKARADQLRRLQLAAQGADALLFAIRPLAAQSESSPAPVRIACRSTYQHGSNLRRLQLHILKRRGPVLETPVLLELAQPVATSRRTRTAIHQPTGFRPESTMGLLTSARATFVVA